MYDFELLLTGSRKEGEMIDKCKCSLAISLVGDGCRYCQPQEYIDNLSTWLEEERAENTNLRRLVKEYFDVRKLSINKVAKYTNEHKVLKALRSIIGEE